MSKKLIFKGCATAIVTPFDQSGAVDYNKFGELVRRQIALKADAIVIAGTTGECATLSDDEFANLVALGVQEAEGRVPIIAGTGRNDTEKSLTLSKIAQSKGADGLLMVNPYYNKSTQTGLLTHFRYIADRVQIPIILYNVPSRTGMSFTADTYAQLAKHENIVGVKEASGDFSLVLCTKMLCPSDFAIYSGNDDQVLPVLALGGSGIISTVSNIIPSEMAMLCQKYWDGNGEEALRLQLHMLNLIEALFYETNPIPLKYAMEKMGLCEGHMRLPLIKAGDRAQTKLDNALASLCLI